MKSIVESITESLSNDFKKVQKYLKKNKKYNQLKGNCEAWINTYDRGVGDYTIYKFDAEDKNEALKILLNDAAKLYIGDVELKDGKFIVDDEDEYDFDGLLEFILSQNGDGCDYIEYFSFKNDTIMDEIEDPYEIIDAINDEVIYYNQI